jgi:hypothetical protein
VLRNPFEEVPEHIAYHLKIIQQQQHKQNGKFIESNPMGLVIQGFYLPFPFTFLFPFSERLLSGPTEVSSLTLRPLLFRDFDVIVADEPARSIFRHLNPRCFAPKEKNKKLNKQFIILIYKEFCPLLLFGLKIENAFKNVKMGMSHACRQLTKNFT